MARRHGPRFGPAGIFGFRVAQDRGGVVIDSNPHGEVHKDLQRGDLLVQISSERVWNHTEMSKAILKLPAMPSVELVVVRNQREQCVRVNHRLEVPRL